MRLEDDPDLHRLAAQRAAKACGCGGLPGHRAACQASAAEPQSLEACHPRRPLHLFRFRPPASVPGRHEALVEAGAAAPQFSLRQVEEVLKRHDFKSKRRSSGGDAPRAAKARKKAKAWSRLLFGLSHVFWSQQMYPPQLSQRALLKTRRRLNIGADGPV